MATRKARVNTKAAVKKRKAATNRKAVKHTPGPKRKARGRLTIGTLVDRYDIADLDVKALEAQLAAAKKIKLDVENQILDRFSKDDIKGASGSNGAARLSVTTNKSPTIVDRAKLDDYIKRKKAYELMQGRVNKKAWLDRMEADKKPIPGVKTFEKVTLKLTRSK